MKTFWTSKINWAAIILILVSIKDAIATLDIAAMTVQTWVTFAIGIAIIIIRTYFTSQPIK